MTKFRGFLCIVALVCATLSIVSAPSRASGGGNSGGGGGNKPIEVRVTGYITAIDYVNGTVTVGASYYGTGNLYVTSSTKCSLDNLSCNFADIQLGDWAEARYEYYSRVATKLSCISMP